MIKGTDQTSPPNLLGISQFKGTGSSISRIGERLFLLCLALRIQSVERLVGHQDLTPDFKVIRPAAALQGLRHIRNHPDIVGHVVSDDSVASGQRAEQLAVPVIQADGSSVKFQFA